MNYKILLPNDFPKKLLDLSYSLENLGIGELAWKWEEAISVVEFLSERNYGILGGDVIEFTDHGLRYTHDNWYVDKDQTMSWQDYVIISKKKAISYIRRYNIEKGDDFCYTIVFKKE